MTQTTTLVIDLATSRVIWFTPDTEQLVQPPDEKSATVEYVHALPPEMTHRNCFNYALRGDKLVLSVGAPAKSALALAQGAAFKELQRKFTAAAASELSGSAAGTELRRRKLAAAMAGDIGSPLLRVVAAQCGIPVTDVPQFLLRKDAEQLTKLTQLESERWRVWNAISMAKTQTEVTSALLSFNSREA